MEPGFGTHIQGRLWLGIGEFDATVDAPQFAHGLQYSNIAAHGFARDLQVGGDAIRADLLKVG